VPWRGSVWSSPPRHGKWAEGVCPRTRF